MTQMNTYNFIGMGHIYARRPDEKENKFFNIYLLSS